MPTEVEAQPGLGLGAMYAVVTCNTEGDQILARIVAGSAAKFFVVDLQIGHCAARLASPAVSAEHLVAKLVVQVGIEAQTFALWSEAVHEAFSIT